MKKRHARTRPPSIWYNSCVYSAQRDVRRAKAPATTCQDLSTSKFRSLSIPGCCVFDAALVPSLTEKLGWWCR